MAIELNSVVRPLAYYFNASTNQLTKLFYSHLNPTWDKDRRFDYAAKFNYDIKVTLYNLASALTIYKTAALFFGFSAPAPTLITIALVLLIRKVIDRSISIKENGGSTIQAALDKLRGKQLLEDCSVWDNTLSAGLTAAKCKYKLNNSKWDENMVTIGHFTVFKNWHLTIPDAMKHFGIA